MAKPYLVLLLGPSSYELTRIEDADGWQLVKPDGEVYHAHKDKHGTHCTCGDHIFRKKTCKHIKALEELGLLK